VTQRLSHAPRALREAPSRMTARVTRPPTSSIRPKSPVASELFTVLPALDGKPWLRVLEVLEQPPAVFQVHGLTERCVELARRVNPGIAVIQLSATRGDGMDAWLHWLQHAGQPA